MDIQKSRGTEKELVKTNRELHLERLGSMSAENLAKELLSPGKCRMCSNFFWDGNHAGCHQNINESSCEKGMAEFLESFPGEDLAQKYRKKYWYCKDHAHAQDLKALMGLIYEKDLVKIPEKSRYIGCSRDCIATACFRKFQNILDMYGQWKAAELAKIEDDTRRKQRGLELHPGLYLDTVLIPRITDPEKKKAAGDLSRKCFVEKKPGLGA